MILFQMIKFTMFVVYDYHMVSLLKIVGQKLRRKKRKKEKEKIYWSKWYWCSSLIFTIFAAQLGVSS